MDGSLLDTRCSGFDPALADGAFTVIGRDGVRYLLPGVDGYRLMEIMRDCGLPVPALCGGACACGTCHVFVEPDWLARLPAAQSEEEEKLDSLLHAQPNSRLSCQIIWQKPCLDGLVVSLAPLEE